MYHIVRQCPTVKVNIKETKLNRGRRYVRLLDPQPESYLI